MSSNSFRLKLRSVLLLYFLNRGQKQSDLPINTIGANCLVEIDQQISHQIYKHTYYFVKSLKRNFTNEC